MNGHDDVGLLEQVRIGTHVDPVGLQVGAQVELSLPQLSHPAHRGHEEPVAVGTLNGKHVQDPQPTSPEVAVGVLAHALVGLGQPPSLLAAGVDPAQVGVHGGVGVVATDRGGCNLEILGLQGGLEGVQVVLKGQDVGTGQDGFLGGQPLAGDVPGDHAVHHPADVLKLLVPCLLADVSPCGLDPLQGGGDQTVPHLDNGVHGGGNPGGVGQRLGVGGGAANQGLGQADHLRLKRLALGCRCALRSSLLGRCLLGRTIADPGIVLDLGGVGQTLFTGGQGHDDVSVLGLALLVHLGDPDLGPRDGLLLQPGQVLGLELAGEFLACLVLARALDELEILAIAGEGVATPGGTGLDATPLEVRPPLAVAALDNAAVVVLGIVALTELVDTGTVRDAHVRTEVPLGFGRTTLVLKVAGAVTAGELPTCVLD